MLGMSEMMIISVGDSDKDEVGWNFQQFMDDMDAGNGLIMDGEE